MKNEPMQLAGARRCGAKTRSGRPCRSPAVHGRPRCRMHGCAPGSGGPPGEQNGMFKHGRYSRRTKELGALMRKMAKDGEALVARTMVDAGLRPLKAIRRKAHVRKALAAAKAKEEQE